MEADGYRPGEDVEARIRDNVRFYGSMGSDALGRRIEALEEEWDVDRWAMAAGAGTVLASLVLGLLGSRLWRILAWTATPVLLLHAAAGRSTAGDFLRRLGLRTRREIEEEKYALKALRGDFRGVEGPTGTDLDKLSGISARALDAVKA